MCAAALLLLSCEKKTDGNVVVEVTGPENAAFTVAAEAAEGLEIRYTLKGATEGASVEAFAETDWIVDTDTSAAGVVRFGVTANATGAERSGDILLLYPDADIARVSVTQLPEGVDPEDPRPSLTATTVTDVTTSGATFTATLTYDGDKAITEAGFSYTATGETSPTTFKTEAVAGEMSAAVSGLKSATTYFVEAYAIVDGATYKGKLTEFTTLSEGGTSEGNVYRTGWAELPAEYDADGNGIDDNDATLYYAHHLCDGPEKNAQYSGSARNFTVCFSAEHHCPVWVAAPRHRDLYEGTADRTNAYKADPKIPSGIQYYSKSTGGGCNKGHMLGSNERTSSSATNRQVFYYSNIAPQNSSTFNTGGGAWNNLEDYVDDLVCADTLYMVIGCYFDKYTDKRGNTANPSTISFGGRSDVSCPTMFYYALLRTKSGRSGKNVRDCSASELQCVAFVKCHKAPKFSSVSSQDMISISELEKLTGFTYFPNVPNAPKDTYSPSDWDL